MRSEIAKKLGNNRKYIEANIRYINSLEIMIVARSLRSLVEIYSNLTTYPTRSLIWNKTPPHRISNARGIGFRLGSNFRASETSEGRVIVCHKPTVWHMGTLKYSYQPEEPEVFVLVPTDKSLQFINSFTYIVIFQHSTVQSDIRIGWQYYVITGNIWKAI